MPEPPLVVDLMAVILVLLRVARIARLSLLGAAAIGRCEDAGGPNQLLGHRADLYELLPRCFRSSPSVTGSSLVASPGGCAWRLLLYSRTVVRPGCVLLRGIVSDLPPALCMWVRQVPNEELALVQETPT
jgi:hypothetical protein